MQKIFIAVATLFAAFIGFILYSENTGNQLPQTVMVRSITNGDKFAHFLLFGALSFLVNLAAEGKCFVLGRWSVYRGTALVLLFAMLEEGSQYFLPTRTFDYFDLLADVLGILMFAIATGCVYKNRKTLV